MGAAALCAGAALAACSLFVSTGDLSGEGAEAAPPEPDAGLIANDAALVEAGKESTDGGVLDASSEASPPCTNLLLNGGFENKSSCDPWSNYNGGSANVGAPARTGSAACRACIGGKAINLYTVLNGVSFAPGETVRFTAWLRADNATFYAVPIDVNVGRPGTTFESKSTKRLTLSDTYQRIEVDYVFPLDGGAKQTADLQIIVGSATGTANDCILADDLSLCR